jgi:hypothetical protein
MRNGVGFWTVSQPIFSTDTISLRRISILVSPLALYEVVIAVTGIQKFHD